MLSFFSLQSSNWEADQLHSKSSIPLVPAALTYKYVLVFLLIEFLTSAHLSTLEMVLYAYVVHTWTHTSSDALAEISPVSCVVNDSLRGIFVDGKVRMIMISTRSHKLRQILNLFPHIALSLAQFCLNLVGSWSRVNIWRLSELLIFGEW